MTKWLSIVEYSTKFGISPSTIRRKIKANKIAYKTENGKYLISTECSGPAIMEQQAVAAYNSFDGAVPPANSKMQASEEIITFAEKSISTITKIHEDLLTEKDKRLQLQEGMITQLREEIGELRMLVKVLEDRQMGVTQL